MEFDCKKLMMLHPVQSTWEMRLLVSSELYWLVLTILILVSSATPTDQRSKDDSGLRKQYSLDDFEIVIPSIIDDGSYKIYKNTHGHSTRSKREATDDKPLQLMLAGNGEHFRLQLWENDKLLAPGFKIYRRKSLNSSANKEFLDEQVQGLEDQTGACHFTGHVTDFPERPASISLCNGVNGLIRSATDDYIIEPLRERQLHGPESFVGQPHKLYKRSTLYVARQQRYFEGQRTDQESVTVEQPLGSDLVIQEGTEKERVKRARTKFDFLSNLQREKTVETLVVVDKDMYHKHGDANITTYTLTLFNMVSQLFQDSSLGNMINVVLVGLILLEGDERGLNIDYNADDTLNSFCSWQSVLVGSNGRQHDHAILLTGLDLCSYKNSPCDTLGFAPIEGMCNRLRSCTVNEDTGLSTAFTIAHEVGHNFGMFHDGEGNFCTQSAGKLMSPTLMGKDGQFHWSVCSKAYLMRFLNTPQSDCLDNAPKHVAELKFPDRLPGELYNADIQCKWQFGSRARLCTYDFGKDICKALWCYRGNKRCETKFLPAAEGTSCGTGMWCRKGQCVNFGNDGPKPVDGGWSDWSEWSDCSRSCGGGVMHRERECSRPLPQYGGKVCPGDEKIFKMCNVQDCHAGQEDFHAEQCSIYDKQPFQGLYLQWKPQKKLNEANEPCKLHCVAETSSYVFTIKHTSTDGMKCGDEDRQVCVEGACRRVGCDWIIESDAFEDMCGICKGDNSTCRLIHGEYKEHPKLNTYFPITIIPKAARSIKIREESLSSNYLAIRNIFGRYYLNGQQRVAWPGIYKLGGAKFIYRRPYSEPETLEANGPLEEELVLEMLVQDRNPGIYYEYTLPKIDLETTTSMDNYSWSASVSSCSEPCAGDDIWICKMELEIGTSNSNSQISIILIQNTTDIQFLKIREKTISVICHKNFQEEVDPSYCSGIEKPETGALRCNEHPCEPRWVPEDWKPCSKKCGGGKQQRKLHCRQKMSATQDKKLKKKFCKHLSKPLRLQSCNQHECPPAWHAGKWSKCSVTCGQGEQKRHVTCRRKGIKGLKIFPDSMCHDPKPDIIRSCDMNSCPEINKYDWLLSPWGPCSKTCDEGYSSRTIKCYQIDAFGKPHRPVQDHFCLHIPRPNAHLHETCMILQCPMTRVITLSEWHASAWSQCSTSCGNGTQTRVVSCVNSQGETTTGCKEDVRPAISQPCITGECLPTPEALKVECGDKFSWCSLVPQHNFCGKKFYGENCCKSCFG